MVPTAAPCLTLQSSSLEINVEQCEQLAVPALRKQLFQAADQHL